MADVDLREEQERLKREYEETREALRRYTERYCVVYQTLANAPEPETTWEFT